MAKILTPLLALVLAVVLACVFLPEPSVFVQYPLTGEATMLSGMKVPIPYHNYDAEVAVFLGSVDAAKAEARLPPKSHLVLNDQGRALANLLLIQYHNTSIGPYSEVVFAFQVSSASQPQLKGKQVASILAAMFDGECSEAKLFVEKVWLDKVKPIDYGKEFNGVDKYLANFSVVHSEGSHYFKVDDQNGIVVESQMSLPRGLSFLKQTAMMIPVLLPSLTWTSVVKLLTRKFQRWSAVGKPNLISGAPPDAYPLFEFLAGLDLLGVTIGYTKEGELKSGTFLNELGFISEFTAYLSHFHAVMPLPHSYATK